MNILRIDSSSRFEGSVTRQLADELIAGLRQKHPILSVRQRELSDGLPVLSEDWTNANFTDPADRSDKQRGILDLSDRLVSELKHADAVVIAAPIYNFSIPATLKSWIDHIARARETFRYTDTGVEGLLADRPVYILMASGGMAIGSEMDFASDYLRHIFGFIGISSVKILAAGGLLIDVNNAMQAAQTDISEAVGASS